MLPSAEEECGRETILRREAKVGLEGHTRKEQRLKEAEQVRKLTNPGWSPQQRAVRAAEVKSMIRRNQEDTSQPAALRRSARSPESNPPLSRQQKLELQKRQLQKNQEEQRLKQRQGKLEERKRIYEEQLEQQQQQRKEQQSHKLPRARDASTIKHTRLEAASSKATPSLTDKASARRANSTLSTSISKNHFAAQACAPVNATRPSSQSTTTRTTLAVRHKTLTSQVLPTQSSTKDSYEKQTGRQDKVTASPEDLNAGHTPLEINESPSSSLVKGQSLSAPVSKLEEAMSTRNNAAMISGDANGSSSTPSSVLITSLMPDEETPRGKEYTAMSSTSNKEVQNPSEINSEVASPKPAPSSKSSVLTSTDLKDNLELDVSEDLQQHISAVMAPQAVDESRSDCVREDMKSDAFMTAASKRELKNVSTISNKNSHRLAMFDDDKDEIHDEKFVIRDKGRSRSLKGTDKEHHLTSTTFSRVSGMSQHSPLCPKSSDLTCNLLSYDLTHPNMASSTTASSTSTFEVESSTTSQFSRYHETSHSSCIKILPPPIVSTNREALIPQFTTISRRHSDHERMASQSVMEDDELSSYHFPSSSSTTRRVGRSMSVSPRHLFASDYTSSGRTSVNDWGNVFDAHHAQQLFYALMAMPCSLCVHLWS